MKFVFALFVLLFGFNSFAQEEIVDFPDVEAEFLGGIQGLKRYMSDNFEYPIEAIEKNEKGRVYIRFVVEIDGSISNIKVKRGVSDAIDGEAVRLIQNMPKWKPAEEDGKLVRSRVEFPISFRLD